MAEEQQNRFLIPAAVSISLVIVAIAAVVSFKGGEEPILRFGNLEPKLAVEVGMGDLPLLGQQEAPITIVVFSDYQCSYCGVFFKEIFPRLKLKYVDTGSVRLAYRDFAVLDEVPGVQGRESHWTAEAARCANDQNEFWEYHEHLFRNQGVENGGFFSKENLKVFARELVLDEERFTTCLDSGKYVQAVIEDTDRGYALGVYGTPTFFIGVGDRIHSDPAYLKERITNTTPTAVLADGLYVAGSFPYEYFDDLLSDLLAEIQ